LALLIRRVLRWTTSARFCFGAVAAVSAGAAFRVRFAAKDEAAFEVFASVARVASVLAVFAAFPAAAFAAFTPSLDKMLMSLSF
jgi:hypothetical protein